MTAHGDSPMENTKKAVRKLFKEYYILLQLVFCHELPFKLDCNLHLQAAKIQQQLTGQTKINTQDSNDLLLCLLMLYYAKPVLVFSTWSLFFLIIQKFAALKPSQWMQISVYSCVIIHPSGTEWECQISDMTLAVSADWQLGTWRKGWDQCSDWQRLSIPWHPFFLCSHLSVSCFQLEQAKKCSNAEQ